MTSNLLQAAERNEIEAMLGKLDTEDGPAPSYQRLLGFLSGVVITPGFLVPSQWIQPLLDKNGIVFQDIGDANRFMGALMPLYNRINDLRLQGENLCPFELSGADLETMQRPATDWGKGLHDALTLRAEIWVPEKHEVRHVPRKLLDELESAMPFLWALAEPESIPEIVPDPVPFQRMFLDGESGWREEMLRETWDEELIELFGVFCLGRLKVNMDVLQRYAKAYGKGAPAAAQTEPVSRGVKVGRNDPCPCGSEKKFKKCCGA